MPEGFHVTDKEFINGIRGTLGFIKVLVASASGLIVVFASTSIALYQHNSEVIADMSNRLAKIESRIPDLLEFKREIEEQGSPILRDVIKDVDALRYEMRNRQRPDVEDAKN